MSRRISRSPARIFAALGLALTMGATGILSDPASVTAMSRPGDGPGGKMAWLDLGAQFASMLPRGLLGVIGQGGSLDYGPDNRLTILLLGSDTRGRRLLAHRHDHDHVDRQELEHHQRREHPTRHRADPQPVHAERHRHVQSPGQRDPEVAQEGHYECNRVLEVQAGHRERAGAPCRNDRLLRADHLRRLQRPGRERPADHVNISNG